MSRNLKKCFKRFKTTLCAALFFVLLQPLCGDELQMKNGRLLFGQFLRLDDDKIVFLSLAADTLALQQQSINKNYVDTIADEGGFILFKEGRLTVEDPLPFYRPLYSNWEFLRHHCQDSLPDTLHTHEGQFIFGRVLRVEEEALFLETAAVDSNIIPVRRLALATLADINGIPVRILEQSAPLWPGERDEGPLWALAIGVDYGFIAADKIETLFQKAYDTAGLNYSAEKRPSGINGLFAVAQLNLVRRLQLLLSLHYTPGDNANRFSRSAAQLRYNLWGNALKLGLRGGVVFKAWRFAEKQGEEDLFEWRGSAAGPLVGADLQWTFSESNALRFVLERELLGSKQVDIEAFEVSQARQKINWNSTRLALSVLFYF